MAIVIPRPAGVQHKIVSGETPEVGLRVFTNDWIWGTITEVGQGPEGTDQATCGTYCTAWHRVSLDRGGSRDYNCDRLTTKVPS